MNESWHLAREIKRLYKKYLREINDLNKSYKNDLEEAIRKWEIR